MRTYLSKTFQSASRRHLILLSIILAAGIAVRVGPTLVAEYPLNLGGFFYVIIEEIEKCGLFCYPESIPYYGGTDGVPFVYPPVGFFVTAAVHTALPFLSLFTVLKGMSIVLNTAAMLLFAGLAYSLLDRTQALAAVLAFATIPAAFVKLVGTPAPIRTLGFVLLLAGAYYYSRQLSGPVVPRHGAVLGAFTALSGLTHPVMGVGAVLTSFVLMLHHRSLRRPDTRSVLRTGGAWAAGLTATLLPYLGILAMRGQLSLLVNGGTSKGFLNTVQLALKYESVTGEPFVSIWGAVSMLGVFYVIREGKLYLAYWLISTLFLVPAYFSGIKVVPASLVGGVFFERLYFWMSGKDGFRERVGIVGVGGMMVAVVGLYTLGGAFTYSITAGTPVLGRVASNHGGLVQLNESRMDNFKRVANKVESEGEVLFLASNQNNVEWGPAISKRAAFAMPYGEEWTGKFERWYDLKLKMAGRKCVFDVLRLAQNEREFLPDYVYIQGLDYLTNTAMCGEEERPWRLSKVFEDGSSVLWRVTEK